MPTSSPHSATGKGLPMVHTGFPAALPNQFCAFLGAKLHARRRDHSVLYHQQPSRCSLQSQCPLAEPPLPTPICITGGPVTKYPSLTVPSAPIPASTIPQLHSANLTPTSQCHHTTHIAASSHDPNPTNPCRQQRIGVTARSSKWFYGVGWRKVEKPKSSPTALSRKICTFNKRLGIIL